MEKSFSERVAEARAAVSAINAREANARQTENPEVVFLDPRDLADIESTTGLIPGAVNLPLRTLSDGSEEDLLRTLRSRTRPIITACEGGPMGAIAAHTLQQRGFSNVCFIDGGTRGWLDAGYATQR